MRPGTILIQPRPRTLRRPMCERRVVGHKLVEFPICRRRTKLPVGRAASHRGEHGDETSVRLALLVVEIGN